MWFYLALASACFISIRRVAEKPVSGKIPYFSLGWASLFLSLPVLLVSFMLSPRTQPLVGDPYKFWLPLLLIWFVLWPIQTYSYYRALHQGNISEIVPVLSLSPIFVVGISRVLTGESPSSVGMLGIVCTVIGILLLNIHSLKSFSDVKNNTPLLLMFLSSMSIALGSSLDKVALSVSSPQWYTLVNVFGASLVLFVIARLNRSFSRVLLVAYSGPLLLVGIFQSLVFSTYFIALQDGMASYVIALRNLNVIVSALLGIVFFHETLTRRKLFSFLLIGLGILVLGFLT